MLQARDLGRDALGGKLEGPIVAGTGWQIGSFEGCQGIVGPGGPGAIPMGTVVDPVAHVGDLGRGKGVALHRHDRLVETRNVAIEAAVFRASRYDRRAPRAALEGIFPSA